MEFDEPVELEVMGEDCRTQVSVEGEKNTMLDRAECAQRAQIHLYTEAS